MHLPDKHMWIMSEKWMTYGCLALANFFDSEENDSRKGGRNGANGDPRTDGKPIGTNCRV